MYIYLTRFFYIPICKNIISHSDIINDILNHIHTDIDEITITKIKVKTCVIYLFLYLYLIYILYISVKIHINIILHYSSYVKL